MILKTILASALVSLALAGCQTNRPASPGATAPAAGVANPAGNTAGLPRNDTTGANVAQNCSNAATQADRDLCLSRGTAPTSPSDRPQDGGN